MTVPSRKWTRVATTDHDVALDETCEGTQDTDSRVHTNDAAGKRVLGEQLQPVGHSTTVRRRRGKAMVTDGPFAESREWIVGG